MVQEWAKQDASQIATELCGFVTILSGTFLLHRTKDMGNRPSEVHSSSDPLQCPDNTKTPQTSEI